MVQASGDKNVLPGIAVVVLGEISRSPRMVNHAVELARAGFDVTLIGYCSREFRPPHGVRVHALRPRGRAADRSGKLTFLVRSAIRMGLLGVALLKALLEGRRDAVLVQNPPSFPTLAAAWIASRCRRSRLVVDWHNYGFSLLALRLGDSHVVVRLARWYEVWAGRRASAHFCVSAAMRRDLQSRFGIEARVLYDRPVRFFEPAQPENGTRLLVVCPCGWTADEDTGLLLDALEMARHAPLTLFITGDGPLRESFDSRIDELRRQGLDIRTGFLPVPEYEALLRRADIGVSVHRSSSGVDLAMKVVDLFSAGAPVCALDYGGSLPEQVRDGETGYLFREAPELARILTMLGADQSKLVRARERVRAEWRITWADEWSRVALPVLRGN